ncbi:hypothetical protein DFH27DRAFT_303160 [Peziza echinospora]|nr:hypothetical protein DFH27DRAFT_303160 [Peziza echinospora]
MLVVNAPGIISIYGHLNRNGRADHELRSHSADFHPHAPPIPQIVLPAKTIPGSTRTTCSSPNQLAQANRLSNHIPGWKPLSGSSGFSSPRSKRSRTPDVEHGHHGRDSAEHIIGFPSSGEKENAKLETTERSMVIHQEISYAVTEEYCPVPYDQQSHNHNRNSDYYYEDGARISRRSRDKRSSRGSGAYDLENIDFDSEIEDGDPEDINNGGGEDPEYTSTRTSTGGHGGTTCTQSGSGDSNGMEIVPAMLNDHQMHGVKESEGI